MSWVVWVCAVAASACFVSYLLGRDVGRAQGEVHGKLDERCRWLIAADRCEAIYLPEKQAAFWRILVKQVRLGGWDK